MGIHRRRRATQHTAAMTLCPPGSDGVGPSASFPLLADVPHRLVAAPRMQPHGVPNADVDISRTGSQEPVLKHRSGPAEPVPGAFLPIDEAGC
jgi:hypothetical protein